MYGSLAFQAAPLCSGGSGCRLCANTASLTSNGAGAEAFLRYKRRLLDFLAEQPANRAHLLQVFFCQGVGAAKPCSASPYMYIQPTPCHMPRMSLVPVEPCLPSRPTCSALQAACGEPSGLSPQLERMARFNFPTFVRLALHQSW